MIPLLDRWLTRSVFRGDLPARITGIVFWGLVLVGLVLSVFLLHGQERYLQEKYTPIADAFAFEVLDILAEFSDRQAAIETLPLNNLLSDLGLSYAEIELDSQLIKLGGSQVPRLSIPFSAAISDRLDARGIKRLDLYDADLDDEVTAQRKHLLVLMGALFLVFGFILQLILQRVLTTPFTSMLDTARKFTAGNTDARFEENRNDEFGFLGKFINRALDYLLLQQRELREALQQVRQSEFDLYQEKEKAVVTLHSIGDAVITTDENGLVEYFNPVAERLTGWNLADIQGDVLRDFIKLVDEDTGEELENPVDICLRNGKIVELKDHTVLYRRTGDKISIADSAAPIRDRSGKVIGAVMVFHDVGQARKLARQLSYQASHDALTGLYNRREFENQLHTTLESVQHDGKEHAVCYLDLDQFKLINDTCGHGAGDEMLMQLAGLIGGHVRDTDILARLGGDEFGILLNSCSMQQARRIAEELRNAVADFRFIYDDHSFDAGVSIGLVAVNQGSQNLTEILSAADVACYAAKEGGRNRVHVYEPNDEELKKRRGEMRWVSRIRKALEEDRFVLYQQPIVSVQNREAAGLSEVLIRMLNEAGEEIPPMAFIPAAERYDLMPLIDRWVVETLLTTPDISKFLPPQDKLTINLSGQSIGNDQFLKFVLDLLDVTTLDPKRICFEITETAAISNLRRATRFLNALKAKGCAFALDDFGSGLSSFAYLKNLKVDYLKIDGSFVRDMKDDDVDCAMVEAINQIGHVLGIATIAEFVENEETFTLLSRIGVDFAQGFWVRKPYLLHRPLDKFQESEEPIVPKSSLPIA